MRTNTSSDLFCFSHLRWDFVYQRPQHLMSRFARNRRVFYFEEPVYEDTTPYLKASQCPASGVYVLTPVLPPDRSRTIPFLRSLLASAITTHRIKDFMAWYYTPTAIEFSAHLQPCATIYDCMDELSAFLGAPPSLHRNEEALLRHADLVFTGGHSLYESKRGRHHSVHLFPSSIDTAHFRQARAGLADPADQRSLPRPRLGYAGVIDERMDLALLRHAAAARPEWQFILLGPVVKIDPATLPQAPNLHYLGMKSYADLPAYLSGWSIGLLPFAINEATRYISPTKTPEYLAAGLRVVSTPIRDVVRTYSPSGLVSIAPDVETLVAEAERLLAEGTPPGFLQLAADHLASQSWDRTFLQMNALMQEVCAPAGVMEGVLSV